MKPLAYFARPVTHYNQPWDDNTLKQLEAAGFKVIDPNTPEMAAAYEAQGMKAFTDVVAICDVVFYRTFADGSIGAGVHKELVEAETRGIPIIRLAATAAAGCILDVPQTRERVANGVI